MIIYQRTLPEFKGNLHTHTTLSDGRLAPLDAVKAYEEAGYDFLCLTDHQHLTRVPEYQGRLLLLNGIELDDEPSQSEVVHLLGIGVRESLESEVRHGMPARDAIGLIHANGGLCFLAHPHWSMNRPATLRQLKGLDGAEIFNAVSRPPYNADRADATHLLDLLASEGRLLRTIANDDAHFYDKELFQAAVIVQAPALTRDDILSALRQGHYYASQGPRFESVTVEGDTVKVRCTPVNAIMFHSNLAWNANRAATGQGLTQASYPLDHKRGESFVRVVIEDAQGRRAWMNPFGV